MKVVQKLLFTLTSFRSAFNLLSVRPVKVRRPDLGPFLSDVWNLEDSFLKIRCFHLVELVSLRLRLLTHFCPSASIPKALGFQEMLRKSKKKKKGGGETRGVGKLEVALTFSHSRDQTR